MLLLPENYIDPLLQVTNIVELYYLSLKIYILKEKTLIKLRSKPTV